MTKSYLSIGDIVRVKLLPSIDSWRFNVIQNYGKLGKVEHTHDGYVTTVIMLVSGESLLFNARSLELVSPLVLLAEAAE